MLKQATVDDISKKRVTKLHGSLYVVTRYYPRFLKRNLIHEYYGSLSPAKELLHEFKSAEAEIGDHDHAFVAMNYEEKFRLSNSGFSVLREIATESSSKDVYLVCHCRVGQYCHREILLLIVREMYDVPTGKLHFPWATFRKRMANRDITLADNLRALPATNE